MTPGLEQVDGLALHSLQQFIICQLQGLDRLDVDDGHDEDMSFGCWVDVIERSNVLILLQICVFRGGSSSVSEKTVGHKKVTMN